MKKLITHIIIILMAKSALAQSLAVDSLVSRDSTTRLRLTLPVNHKFALFDLFENGRRLAGSLTRDTTTADSVEMMVNQTPPGIYSYQVTARRWSKNPCNPILKNSNAITVQVGPNRCCRVPFTNLTNPATKSISVTWALCASCTSYTVVYKQLASTNPLVKPAFNQNVKGTGTRLSNYRPTIQEAAAGTITRRYPTSFSGFWYQVDLVCNGSGCAASSTTFSNLIFTR